MEFCRADEIPSWLGGATPFFFLRHHSSIVSPYSLEMCPLLMASHLVLIFVDLLYSFIIILVEYWSSLHH